MRRLKLLRPGGRAAQVLGLLAGLALALGMATQASPAVYAQAAQPSLAITRVESQDFPTVTAYLRVTGANGLPLVGLAASDFVVEEDGQPVPPANVTLESDTSQQISFVLVIDVSLPPEDLAQVQAAANEFVAALGPQDQVAVLSVYDQVVEVQRFTSDKALLAQAITQLTAGGNSTEFNQAADTAVNLLSALPAGRKAVIMLTNSGDTTNSLSPEPILEKAQAGQIPIYPFGFGQNVNEEVLENWARFSGGQAYLLGGPGEVRPNLQTLGVLLRQSYKIVFQSGLQADNASHDLAIRLEYQDQTAEAAAEFTALPGTVTIEGPGLTNGQTLRGMQFLIVDVTAPAPIESVTFLLDDEPLVELTSPPFRFDWDTSTAGEGVHTLTVRAVDRVGNTGETQVSLNVVLPPVPATPTPAPTAAPSVPERVVTYARSTFGSVVATVVRVGRIVLTAGALLAGLVMALVLWLRVRGTQRRQQVQTCQVELSNHGNARARYELRADDPLRALKFQFMLNQARLAQGLGAAGAATGAPPAAAPAKNGKGDKGLAVPDMSKGVNAFQRARDKANQAVSVSAMISDWLVSLSYFLPGRAQNTARKVSSTMRTAQYDAFEANEMPERIQRMAAPVVPVGALRGKKSKDNAAAGSAAPTVGAAGTAALASPAAATAAPAAAAATPAETRAGGWSLTPYIEPGGSLTLSLVITPARAPKTQQYAFRVLSRVADEAEAPLVIEHGSVALIGVPWYRRLAAPALFLIGLALLALLVRYLLLTFGVIA